MTWKWDNPGNPCCEDEDKPPPYPQPGECACDEKIFKKSLTWTVCTGTWNPVEGGHRAVGDGEIFNITAHPDDNNNPISQIVTTVTVEDYGEAGIAVFDDNCGIYTQSEVSWTINDDETSTLRVGTQSQDFITSGPLTGTRKVKLCLDWRPYQPPGGQQTVIWVLTGTVTTTDGENSASLQDISTDGPTVARAGQFTRGDNQAWTYRYFLTEFCKGLVLEGPEPEVHPCALFCEGGIGPFAFVLNGIDHQTGTDEGYNEQCFNFNTVQIIPKVEGEECEYRNIFPNFIAPDPLNIPPLSGHVMMELTIAPLTLELTITFFRTPGFGGVGRRDFYRADKPHDRCVEFKDLVMSFVGTSAGTGFSYCDRRVPPQAYFLVSAV